MPGNYVGNTPDNIYSNIDKRYFYGLRRNEDGELFLYRIDQIKDTDDIEINIPGDITENFQDFEEGFNFFSGRNDDHDVIHPNLKYEQYRWDDRLIYYYINDEGQWVLRTNKTYVYPTGVSSDK
jgi:hypothetical protein